MGVNNPLLVTAHAELVLVDKNVAGDNPIFDPERSLRLTKVTQCVMSLCSRTYGVAVLAESRQSTSPRRTMVQHFRIQTRRLMVAGDPEMTPHLWISPE
jgi:hypothetical protein